MNVRRGKSGSGLLDVCTVEGAKRVQVGGKPVPDTMFGGFERKQRVAAGRQP